MPFLKSRKNLKNRKVSKRNQHGGALSKLWCVYIKANGHYYPVFLTNNKDRKDHYLYELYTNYIGEDGDVSPYGSHFYEQTRVAELSIDIRVPGDEYKTHNKVYSEIVPMKFDDYTEDTAVPEQEDIYYFGLRDADGLIYQVIYLKKKGNESHFKDGEQNNFYWGHVHWRIDNWIQNKYWLKSS